METKPDITNPIKEVLRINGQNSKDKKIRE